MPPIEKASAEKTEKAEESQPAAHEFKDSDEVTVLHGYGKEPATKLHYIDNVTFQGGVAYNVPYVTVKHWQNGTRPDGKLASSRIRLQAVLPQEKDKHGKLISPTEADFIRVTGIKGEVSDAHLAALVSGLNDTKLLSMLTPEQKHALTIRLGGRANG